jgi:hypothetical protein
MAEAYFARLTSAPYKRFVQIGEGTHSVMLEKNRMSFSTKSSASSPNRTPWR